MNDEIEVATESVAEAGENVELSADSMRIKVFLEDVLAKMRFNCVVALTETSEIINVIVSGEDASGVIGHHGEVLDALQYICSILSGKPGESKRVVIDTDGGYRAKREKSLRRLALNLEKKVHRTGRPHSLEHMNPYERRIIHTTLQNSKYVTTESEGQGNARHVVISPKGQNNVLNAPNAPRKTLNFVYRSDKKRRK